MTTPDRFSADLLERSASGYAGFAAALMLERDPAMQERDGAGAPAAWRSHLTQRVLDLAAALSAGEPQLFTGRVLWTRKAFRAQARDEADIRRSIQALRDVLAERLPKPALDAPLACLDATLDELAAPLAHRSRLNWIRNVQRIAWPSNICRRSSRAMRPKRCVLPAARWPTVSARRRCTCRCCCRPSVKSGACGMPAN